MDWKQFTIGLIQHLAWPSVVVIFLIMFKGELSKVVRRIAHLKYKDLELNFDQIQQHAKELEKSSEKKAEKVIESPALKIIGDRPRYYSILCFYSRIKTWSVSHSC